MLQARQANYSRARCAARRGRRRRWCLTVLLIAQLAPTVALGQGFEGPLERSAWPEQWPRFRAWEYAATAVAGTGWLVLNFVPDTPHDEPRWTGGILFDDAARDGLLLSSAGGREAAATASDALLGVLMGYTLLVDSVAVPMGVYRSLDLAIQMTLVNLESLAFNGLLTRSVKLATARLRPSQAEQFRSAYEQGQTAPPGRYTSFFSGHTSTAFTAAGLLCAHHVNLGLYDQPVADGLVCAAGLTVASTAGLMRVLADRHYLTDVLVGAGVGLALGWGLPVLLHYTGPRDERSPYVQVRPIAGAGLMGISARLVF